MLEQLFENMIIRKKPDGMPLAIHNLRLRQAISERAPQ